MVTKGCNNVGDTTDFVGEPEKMEANVGKIGESKEISRSNEFHGYDDDHDWMNIGDHDEMGSSYKRPVKKQKLTNFFHKETKEEREDWLACEWDDLRAKCERRKQKEVLARERKMEQRWEEDRKQQQKHHTTKRAQKAVEESKKKWISDKSEECITSTNITRLEASRGIQWVWGAG